MSLLQLAQATAGQHGLDAALVCAVCEQESAWDTLAIRYEPGFYDRYIAIIPHLSVTEARARAFSWGLMQVMGQTARDHGFQAKYLSALCDPDVGLDVGCRVLKKHLEEKGGDVRAGLLRWNGGGRAAYADEVMARMQKYRE